MIYRSLRSIRPCKPRGNLHVASWFIPDEVFCSPTIANDFPTLHTVILNPTSDSVLLARPGPFSLHRAWREHAVSVDHDRPKAELKLTGTAPLLLLSHEGKSFPQKNATLRSFAGGHLSRNAQDQAHLTRAKLKHLGPHLLSWS